MAPQLPDRARVVVIGGGLIGCSVGYHLAHLGWKDVVLLERDRLTAGSTWHAAGWSSPSARLGNLDRDSQYTRDLYARLEAETGQATLQPCGFIESPPTPIAWRIPPGLGVQPLVRRRRAGDNAFGGEGALSAGEVTTSCGLYVASDGRASGRRDVALARAHAWRARASSRARRWSGCCIAQAASPASHGAGRHRSGIRRHCAGMWARQLGEAATSLIPNQAAEHYYLINEAIPDLPPNLPVLEDPPPTAIPLGGRRASGRDCSSRCARPGTSRASPPISRFGEIPPDWAHDAVSGKGD